MKINSMRFIPFVTIAFFVFACENTAEESEKFSLYFDADSLVTAQLELMDEWKVQVSKDALLNGKKDTSTFLLDSMSLSQELNVFRKANINKPAFDDLYKKNVRKEGNLRIEEYNPVERDNELEVQKLVLKYREDKLLELKAEILEDHWLYRSSRKMKLNFSDEGMYITKYTMEGSQKMILRDKVDFIVVGEIKPLSLSYSGHK